MTWNQKNMKDLYINHHCEIVDKKFGFNQMKEHIPYPCVKCPFNAYQKK